MGFLAWVEQTPVSVFVREDFYAYFILLIFHAWGMAFLVGAALAISLRVLGLARGAPLQRFRRFLPVMWLGVALAVPSGIGLLLGYPAKALTNWVFPFKLVLLASAVWLALKAMRHAARDGGGKAQAAGAIVLLLGGVAAGKLLLYTYHMLLTTD